MTESENRPPARPAVPLLGPRAVARSLGAAPLLSSDGLPWRDLAVTTWRVTIDEFELPAIPETFLVLQTQGRVQCRERGEDAHESQAGRVTVIPPETPVSFSRGGTLSAITLHLSPHRLARLLGGGASAGAAAIETRVGFVDPFLLGAAHALAEEIRDPSERGSLYAEAMADALSLHLLRPASPAAADTARRGELSAAALRTVRDYVEESLAGAVSLDDLARVADLGRFRFAKAFRRATGLAPHRYVTERRIERAKLLLRHGDLPLADVALECGFSSQAHFGERFRAWVGTTPGDYRRGR